jgi:competence protein ComEC
LGDAIRIEKDRYAQTLMKSKMSIVKRVVNVVIIFSLVLISSSCSETPRASWHMINVNYGKLQGDANLLIISDKTIMIDAGYAREAKTEVIPYLNALGISKIDYFFISHPHRDHYEGLASILRAGIKIDELYYKIPADEVSDCCYKKERFLKFVNFAESQGAKLIQPEAGFILTLPNESRIEILHAQDRNLPNEDVDVNDLSLIMKWYINGSSVLFTGDLNQTIGKYLSGDSRMKAQFMKMPHHGGRGVAPNSFFDTVDPEFVLVPGPEWIWCGERGNLPREWVRAKKIPVWVNGLNGHVKIVFEKSRTIVTPERVNGDCKLKAFGEVTINNEL